SKNYKRPIVTMKFVEPSDLFDRHTYEKGANVLHMMRNELGDDLWWKAIRQYVKKFAGQNVETNDFKEAIEEATGRNLDVFFDHEDASLKKVTFKKPRDELLWQLANAGSTWPRIEACRDLGKLVGDPKAIEGLEDALKKDEVWAVRRAAAVALGEIGTAAARDALLGGAKDKDSRVRRGVYRALGNFRKDDGALKGRGKADRGDGGDFPLKGG